MWKRFPFFSGVAKISNDLPGAKPSPLNPLSYGTGYNSKISNKF